MIDLHTHILPGVDDGSPDEPTSLAALQAAVQAGITDVVCTPHYMKSLYENSRANVWGKYESLRALVAEQQLPLTLHLGAEVMLDPTTPDVIDPLALNIDDTRYVLVESELNALPMNYLDLLFEIVRRGWKPVLAHPERYPDIMNRLSLAEDLLYRNVYMQLNGGSLLGGYGKKVMDTAWKMVERGYVHFVASDTHARSTENILGNAAEALRARIDDYTADLLTRINPAKLLAGEAIDYIYVDVVETAHKPTPLRKIRDFLLGR